MNKIKEIFKSPITFGVIGLIIGTVFGLVALGWYVWPVTWTDAAPSTLQGKYQKDYLCMTIDSYLGNLDDDLLQKRWDGLGENASEVLYGLKAADCGHKNAKGIKNFIGVVELQFNVAEPAPEASTEDEVVEPAIVDDQEEPTEAKTISIIPLALLILLTLVAGGILIFLLIKRSKGEGFKFPKAAKAAKSKVVIPKNQSEARKPMEESVKTAKAPPLAQFMTTYRQGDDLYDDSFSIDSVNGEFLGECGVGIAETIGVGEPKKVTALEVWLFDKNDIQTVTKVLLSEHANNDAAMRQRLQSKGEPVLVTPGMQFLMETATLKMEANVIDMVYARGPLPENSYFSRLTLEVSIWQK